MKLIATWRRAVSLALILYSRCALSESSFNFIVVVITLFSLCAAHCQSVFRPLCCLSFLHSLCQQVVGKHKITLRKRQPNQKCESDRDRQTDSLRDRQPTNVNDKTFRRLCKIRMQVVGACMCVWVYVCLCICMYSSNQCFSF